MPTKPKLLHASLLIAIFLDLVGFGMVIPDIQTRLETFGANGLVIGVILSSYFLVQMIVSPLWGQLSDQIGRKRILVVCGVLSAGSMLLYAFAHSPLLILLSRILAGLAAANVVVAQAYVADTITEEAERTTAIGQLGGAITAGLILGPALGGRLAAGGGNSLVGYVAAAISGIGAMWIALLVPNIQPRPEERPRKHIFALNFSLLREVTKLRPLFGFAAAVFFALACLEGTFGRLILHKLGMGPAVFGLIFGYESLLSVLVQSVGVGWLTTKAAPQVLLGAACLLQSVGLGLTPFAPSLAVLFLCSTIYAVGSGLANPLINSLCSAATPEPRQGEMFGLLQAARSSGFLLGPILGSVLFDWRPASPYLFAAFILLLAGLYSRVAVRDVGQVPTSD